MRLRLTVSAGFGPLEVRAFVGVLADALAEDLVARGVLVEDVVVHGDPNAPRSVDLGLRVLSDVGALDGLVGTHALVHRSPTRGGRARKRWFAGVTLAPFAPIHATIVDPGDVRVEVARASGPGGQHVQKTESAVRVVHVPTGIAVRVASERSQHQNRARAMARLAEALAEREAAARADAAGARRMACLGVVRGAPVATWRLREHGPARALVREGVDAS